MSEDAWVWVIWGAAAVIVVVGFGYGLWKGNEHKIPDEKTEEDR